MRSPSDNQGKDVSLTLPRWFKPDRSAEVKGSLKYLEAWGMKRPINNYLPLGLVFLIFIIAVAGMIMSVRMLLLDGEPFGVALILMMVFLMFTGKIVLHDVLWMPFCIYENGFTLVTTPWKKAIRREEVFISWQRLNRVILHDAEFKNEIRHYINFKYDNYKYGGLGHSSLKDPLAAINLLHQYVPDKMNDDFKVYLTDESMRKIITKKSPYKSGGFFLKLFTLFVLTLLSITFAGTINKLLAGDIIFFLTGGIMILFFIIIFFYMLVGIIEKFHQQELIQEKARFINSGISFPITGLGDFIKRTDNIIPWENIKEVNLKLKSTYYYHEAEIETTAGEKYRIPYEIFKQMDELSSFVKHGDKYVNIKSVVSAKKFLNNWDYKGLTLIIFIFTIPSILEIATGGILIQWFGSIFDRVFIFVILVWIVIHIFYLVYRIERRERKNRTIGFSINEGTREISIPNAQNQPQQIPSVDFIKASIEKDYIGKYCRLETTLGVFELSQIVGIELQRAGYPVDKIDDIQ